MRKERTSTARLSTIDTIRRHREEQTNQNRRTRNETRRRRESEEEEEEASTCAFCFAWPLAGESATSVRTRLRSIGEKGITTTRGGEDEEEVHTEKIRRISTTKR